MHAPHTSHRNLRHPLRTAHTELLCVKKKQLFTTSLMMTSAGPPAVEEMHEEVEAETDDDEEVVEVEVEVESNDEEDSERTIVGPEALQTTSPAEARAPASTPVKRRCGQLGCVLADNHAGTCRVPALQKRIPGYSTSVRPDQLPIGKRVRVLWAEDEEYDGTVIDRREELDDKQRPTLTFYVAYEDRDRCWHTLGEQPVKLLPTIRDSAVPSAPPPADLVTHADGFDLKLSKSNETGYVGVEKRAHDFRARVGKKTLGAFPTALAAAVAVAREARGAEKGQHATGDDGERLVEMDGAVLHIYPHVTEYRKLQLHLNPFASSGYMKVQARLADQDSAKPYSVASLGRFASAEEAAYAYAEFHGPPSSNPAREAEGLQLCLNHNAKLGYLFVTDLTSNGYTSMPFRAGSAQTCLGYFATATEAALAVARYLSTLRSVERETRAREQEEAEADEAAGAEEEEEEEEEEAAEEEAAMWAEETGEEEPMQWAPDANSLRGRMLQVLLAAESALQERDEIVSRIQALNDVHADTSRGSIVTALGKEKASRVPLWEQDGTKYSLTRHGESLRESDRLPLQTSSKSASGYLGVYATKSANPEAQFEAVYVKGKQPRVRLGRFATAKLAATCYAQYLRTLPRTTIQTDASRKRAAPSVPATVGSKVARSQLHTSCACNSAPTMAGAASREPAKTAEQSAGEITTSTTAASNAAVPPVPSKEQPQITGLSGFGLLQKVAAVKHALQLDDSLKARDAVNQANDLMGIDAPPGQSLPSQVGILLEHLGIDETTLLVNPGPSAVA